jgi:glycine/D-amino acid oxidase-like deaminating enzyme
MIVLSTSGWSMVTQNIRYRWGSSWENTKTLADSSTGLSASIGDTTATPTTTMSSETYAFEYKSEVVGAYGRMGSFWLCHQEDKNEISHAAAIPRGLAPGYLTKIGCPIFVATPSSSWARIWEQTFPHRREDLIFVGNGIPPDAFHDTTIVVPHYSVLTICKRDDDENPIGTNALSPKTFLYGKHSEFTAKILNRYGVSTEKVESIADIKIRAAMKLVWASCMWLLCHSAEDAPINFETVHRKYQPKLDRLVDETIPALEKFLQQSVNRKEVHDYIKAYSLSIPLAVPSKKVALAELEDRNGFWLMFRTNDSPQKYHQQLIEQIVDKDDFNSLLSFERSQTYSTTEIQGENTLYLKEVGLKVSGVEVSMAAFAKKPLKRVIIVGGGIIGSSIAFFLAKGLPDLEVSVLDLLSEETLGRTTPASWAWLNANGKEPKSYQILNQLGLHVWKAYEMISDLPTWMGSLVRFESPPKFVDEGGYPNKGPLNVSQIMELEPFANWQLSTEENVDNEGFTYLFPDEGCIDPSAAVKRFRNAAKTLGVQFMSNQNVTNILRDEETGSICGVESSNIDSDLMTVTPVDLVIVAAGIGAAAKTLGGLPLLHKPGMISYAKPTADTPSTRRLSRILVDPLRSSHVLQRPDGYIVAGGGALEVGGSSVTQLVYPNTKLSLVETAKKLSPNILNQVEFSHTSKAIRPMPRDGLPAVGYLEQGLYTIVTHSGMTLGPLLSALAAAEIAENISFDLLSPFRPSRFF